MANIATELGKIANSVYGREMRGAIHDAIEKVNDDVEATLRVLTYDEYKALSSEEKLNGTLYFTSDTKQIFLMGDEYTNDNGVISMKKGTLLYFSAASAPLDNLEIELKPVQNTNGYGEVWSGGHGKNKLQLSISGDSTVSDVAFHVTDDSRIIATGTASADIELTIGTFSFSGSGNKDFILNGCPSGGSSTSYRIKLSNKYDYGTDREGTTISLTPSTSYPVKIMIKSGTVLYKTEFKPMIREKGSYHFRPYANVCAISKNTAAFLKSCGINLFDPDTATSVSNYILNDRGEIIPKSGEGYYYGNPIAPNGIYTFSGHFMDDDHVMYVYTFDEIGSIRTVYGPLTYSDLPFTFQAGPLVRYFGFSYQTSEFDVDTVQLEVGNKASARDEYEDHNYILSMGDQSSWGGIWHVTSGFMDEEWDEIQSYNGEELPGEWYSSENTYGVHASPNIGAQVVYKTGNVTRKITGIHMVSTLRGINTMYGSNDEEIFITYTNEAWQDIVHYKELLEEDYIAMSEADKKNGIIYFIQDKGIIYLNDVAYGASGGGGGGSMFVNFKNNTLNMPNSNVIQTEFIMESEATE